MERKRQTEEESREVTGLDSWLGMGDEEEGLPHPDCEASSLGDWQLVKVLTEWKSGEGETALRVELGFRFLVEFGLLLTPLSFGGLYPSPSWTHFSALGKPTPSSVRWCIRCSSAVGCIWNSLSGPFGAMVQGSMKPEYGSNFFIWLNCSPDAKPQEDNDSLSQRMRLNCLEG